MTENLGYIMFWGNNHSSPSIDTILAKQDLKLGEVLDHESIIQDLRSQNAKLMDYITRADVLNDLVTLVTEEPSPNLEEYDQYRWPNLACEVLTTDIPRLNECLSEKVHLVKLFSFFECEPPLNPLLASFVSRTLSLLISRNVDQNWYSYQLTCLRVLEFLKSTENSSQLLLKHLGTSAIMDLTFKLLTQIEGVDMQQNLLDWIESVHLVENIVALFHPSVDADRQANAAHLLCDTIKKLREKDDREKLVDPILERIESTELIRKILGSMFNEEGISEGSISGGISVMLTLLEDSPPEYNSYEGNHGSGDSLAFFNPALPTIISAIVPYLPKLHNLLINPPKKTPIKLACGTIEPPLGSTRLAVIKLISALIATNTLKVNEVLDDLNTVQVLLDLFFHYTWNNFLHSEVDKCLAFALNAPLGQEENPLIANIFVKCRLLQRILEAWKDNETIQEQGGNRRGYMGHLTNIANSVVKQCESDLGTFLNHQMDAETMDLWQCYVNGSLQTINATHKKFLGGVHPGQLNKSNSQSECNSVVFHSFANSSIYKDAFDDDSGLDETEAREKQFAEMCTTKDFNLEDIMPSNDDPWQEAEMGDSTVNDGWANFFEDNPDELKLIKNSVDHVLKEIQDNDWDTMFDDLKGDSKTIQDPKMAVLKEDDKDDVFGEEATKGSSVEEVKEVPNPSESCISSALQPLAESPAVETPVISRDTSEAEKSDNNANLNSFVKDTPLHEEELIDNFRYLSKQGMMSETPDVPQSHGDGVVNKSSSDSLPRPAEDESRDPEAPSDPV